MVADNQTANKGAVELKRKILRSHLFDVLPVARHDVDGLADADSMARMRRSEQRSGDMRATRPNSSTATQKRGEEGSEARSLPCPHLLDVLPIARHAVDGLAGGHERVEEEGNDREKLQERQQLVVVLRALLGGWRRAVPVLLPSEVVAVHPS